MWFETVVHGDTAWTRVIGQLIKGGRAEFTRQVKNALESGVKALILDFYECGYIDSEGLGAMVYASRLAGRNGQRLFVQHLSEDLQTLLELTKLDHLFDIAPSQEFERKCQILLPNFDQINHELIEYFSVHPESLVELHWRKFEELLDAVFRNHGFRTILGTGSADGGIDLRLIQSDPCGELLTLVQAKKYAEAPIRLEAVQAFCAAIDDEKANRGLFVTTSRYLPGAHSFAERQRHRLVLADSTDVARWCQQAVNRLGQGARSILSP